MPAQFPAFVVTTVLLLAVPGPDFVVVTRNVLTGDRRRGYRTVVGICAGLAVLTLVTASGVAAIVAADATMMRVLRVVGGAYLLALGVLMLLSARRHHSRPEARPPAPRVTRSPVAQGFFNNVLNPKALVFYLTFLPQFVHPDAEVFDQTVLLGASVVVCAAVWWAVYVTAIGWLGSALERAPVRRAIDAVAGAALAALGVVTLLGAA